MIELLQNILESIFQHQLDIDELFNRISLVFPHLCQIGQWYFSVVNEHYIWPQINRTINVFIVLLIVPVFLSVINLHLVVSTLSYLEFLYCFFIYEFALIFASVLNGWILLQLNFLPLQQFLSNVRSNNLHLQIYFIFSTIFIITVIIAIFQIYLVTYILVNTSTFDRHLSMVHK